MSIALYAKMKGTPWTVDHDLTIADELVIGIGSAELSESRTAEKQRYVGITTVFRGDGNYLLGQLAREASYADYPAVLLDSTRDLIEEIKNRNGWQPGDTVRLVFHAARPPRNVDFARLMRESAQAVGSGQHVEFAFLTVSHDHPFVLFDTSELGKPTAKGPKGEFVPERGLILQTGRYSRLVCTSGVTLVKRPGLPMPRPLQVHLHRGSTFTDLGYLSEQVLKFTGLSWRSTQPAAGPVTIYYSELIAGLLAGLTGSSAARPGGKAAAWCRVRLAAGCGRAGAWPGGCTAVQAAQVIAAAARAAAAAGRRGGGRFIVYSRAGTAGVLWERRGWWSRPGARQRGRA